MSDHIVEVKQRPNGKIICDPNEVHARRKDRITWAGLEHTGTFEGKIDTDQMGNFTQKKLESLKKAGKVSKGRFPGGDFPADTESWKEGTVVKITGKKGVYKYSVTVGTTVVDPVVIIDE